MKCLRSYSLLAIAGAVAAIPRIKEQTSDRPFPTLTSTGTGGYNPSGTAGASFPSSSGSSTDGNDTGPLNIPDNCLKKNQIAVGWLPSAPEDLTQITSTVGGAGACFYGQYSQIKGNPYDGSQLTQVMDVVKNSGAIFIPSVMPTLPLSDVTAEVASQIATSMAKFVEQNIEVWLRFAHEMNWYVTDGTYHGTASEFVTAWKNVAQAIQKNPVTAGKVKMVWSPNNVGGNSQKLISDGWWPGPETVDLVAIDIYPDPGASFEDKFGDFYKTFSVEFGKPFVIAETGSDKSDATAKKEWLEQISSAQAKSVAPNYVGFAWFEYNKDGIDFRVATGGNEDIARSVLASGS
ncbi:MAG: hypothetical protein Q9167_001471 [Letrouitia subvulpina]